MLGGGEGRRIGIGNRPRRAGPAGVGLGDLVAGRVVAEADGAPGRVGDADAPVERVVAVAGGFIKAVDLGRDVAVGVEGGLLDAAVWLVGFGPLVGEVVDEGRGVQV